jgi:rhodanese-related sulfurtransferase
MKYIVTSILVVLFVWSCGEGSQTGVQGLDVATFKETMQAKKEGIILDIRTDAEVASGRIPGAIQIDYYHPDFDSRIRQLDTSKPLFLYCAVGGRSASAIAAFQEAGFKEIYHLQPGMQGWKAAGETIE